MQLLFNKRYTLLAFIALFSSFVYMGTGNEQKPELSQTVPPDMVYIKGNGHIHSFYISKTEEPNIYWRTYTDWLKKVYVNYPEVYKEALPLKGLNETKNDYNDPIIDNYTFHPAYDYYPVVGISWRQIQNYLSWKTDRLNEMILVKSKIIKYDSLQKNEDNFNIETYLEGHGNSRAFDENMRILLEADNNSSNTVAGFYPNHFIMNNGIVIPHYRLPTEAEWDYANIYPKQNVLSKKSYSIYGANYFLNTWIKNANKSEKKPQLEFYPNTNAMESGVQEWLMDIEGFEHKSGYSSFDIYNKNGFQKIDGNGIFDSDGRVDVKNHLGAFKFFFADYDNLNNATYLLKIVGLNNYLADTTVENPFYNNEVLFKKYENTVYSQYFGRFQYTNHISAVNKAWYLSNKTMKIKMIFPIAITHNKRKIKAGNSKSPNSQAYLLMDNEASELVGFRCVLPATSVAVNPKFKVKWD